FNPVMAVSKFLRGASAVPTTTQRTTAAEIRRKLIENFMYLLSAPFLAIAMYYLLLLLAEQVTEPVLVIMAFATGLVSKAVVGGIIEFAETKLPGGKRGSERASALADADAAAAAATGATARVAEEVKTKELKAGTAAQAAREAKANQAKAETAARMAVEA